MSEILGVMGDRLAGFHRALDQLAEHANAVRKEIERLQSENWKGEGEPDEATLNSWQTFQGAASLVTEVMAGFYAAFGWQAEGVKAVGQIGAQAEADSTSAASAFGGSGHRG
jgi:hypothetical protein